MIVFEKSKHLLLNLLFCLPFIFLSAAVNFKSVKITEGVKAQLPSEFSIMTDDDLAVKYPSSKKPLAMFTNTDRLVDFGLNVSKSKWPGNDLTILKQFYKSTLMQMYPKIDFVYEGIPKINKRDFIAFEFTSQFDKTRSYNYLQYTLVKDQVYVFNFTCPAHMQQIWQPVAKKIMASIKMKVTETIDIKPVVKEGVKKYIPKKVPMKAVSK